jgi:hypothetical protein
MTMTAPSSGTWFIVQVHVNSEAEATLSANMERVVPAIAVAVGDVLIACGAPHVETEAMLYGGFP